MAKEEEDDESPRHAAREGDEKREDDPRVRAGGPAGEAEPRARAARSGAEPTTEGPPAGLAWFFGGAFKETARTAGAAYTLTGAILGLGLLGWALDRWLGTSPWGLLVGLLVGIVVGMVKLGLTMLAGR